VALGKDYELQDCPVARALELVGERWTILVIRDCFLGVRRSQCRLHGILQLLDLTNARSPTSSQVS
jgi:DNA-binding HxlR family transcriptional regulator